MSMEEEIDTLLEEAVGKDDARSALKVVREHRNELGDDTVDVVRTTFEQYGTMLKYLRHHRSS